MSYLLRITSKDNVGVALKSCIEVVELLPRAKLLY